MHELAFVLVVAGEQVVEKGQEKQQPSDEEPPSVLRLEPLVLVPCGAHVHHDWILHGYEQSHHASSPSQAT